MNTENLDIKVYDKLHKDAIFIREKVFQKEQGFLHEFDATDEDADTKHIVVYKDNVPIGTCRYYIENSEYKIGRIAIVKEYRGQGIGEFVVRCAEKNIYEIGGREVGLSAQVRAKGFYEKIGYHSEGEIYMDEECPHIAMKKYLQD